MPSKKVRLPLSVTHPEIAAQADGWDATSITSGSNQRVNWICQRNHRWEAKVINRTSGNTGCPYCAGKKILAGFNDLATLFPDIASEAADFDPRTIGKGSTKKLTWKCAKGHLYQASPNSRTNRKSGCSVCDGKTVLIGFNDFESQFPKLATEADGWEPSEFTSGSAKKMPWRCCQGHTWSATIVDRTTKNYGCPYCTNYTVLPGFNDLKTTHPELANQANGWDPKTIMASNSHNFEWLCSEGHSWFATPLNRSFNESGCPSCTVGGFNPNNDGYFYLIFHDEWEMFQIGITNNPDDRLARHRRLGWSTIELRGPMDGHLTQQWETAILRMLKAKGADLSNDKIAGKFDGYSEAWSKSTFDVASIKELMRLTEEYEEK